MNRRFLLCLLVALAGCTTLKSQSQRETASKQMVKHFQFNKTQSIELNYLLFLPKDYAATPAKKWPLILFLHGSGERGTNIWKVAVHGPPKNVDANADFPFIVVSPQCPEGQIWSTDVLLRLLDEVVDQYTVDETRVYLTGLSMGGFGTWNLGMSYPERFAAIVPICGGGEMINVLLSSREKGDALKSLAIWAFHGAKDPVVPVEESQRMVEAAKKVGAQEVKLTIYPEATHDAWTQTYANPELYQWLLKHQRQASSAGGATKSAPGS
jgi:predicted peptidase